MFVYAPIFFIIHTTSMYFIYLHHTNGCYLLNISENESLATPCFQRFYFFQAALREPNPVIATARMENVMPVETIDFANLPIDILFYFTSTEGKHELQ